MKKLLTILLALLLIAAPALALPAPSADFYILDEANVISDATEEYIIYNNDQLFDACGAQIVFAVLDDTEGEAIDDYAYDLFNEWGIGDSKKNNGFLVLMAIDDDNYYALPGAGLERAISGGTVKDLLDTYLEPDFAARDYDAGARKLFDALFTEVCDASAVYLTAGMPAGSTASAKQPAAKTETRRPAEEPITYRDDDSGISTGTIILIIVIIVIVLSLGRSKKRTRRTTTHVPPPPPRKTVIRPVIIPRINVGPRPGHGPRPNPPQHRSHSGGGHIFGGGRTFGGGAGRSMSRPGGGFSRGGRSGGGGSSRGGGAGRGR